ncbi:MAG: RNA polymerase sigma factor [Fimbriiglobus sp.]
MLLRIRNPEDSQAWRLFVDVYGPLIESFARKRGLQSADAADVSQNVLLRVSKRMPSFSYESTKGRFRHWLGAVIRNEIHRFWNRSQRQAVGQGGEDEVFEIEGLEADSDSEWHDAFTTHLVRVACERIRGEFETSTWEAFESTWFRDEAATTVAERLGLTLRAVYVAKSRVAGRLREEITTLADDLI